MKVRWTEQAWRRLSEIEEFIARDRPVAAAKLIDKLGDRGDALANHPARGRKVPEIPGNGLRELVLDRMVPERYWRLWADPIIHDIHMRVLRHVASLSEAAL